MINNLANILTNNYTITIVGGVIVTLICYYLFGIGKSKTKNKNRVRINGLTTINGDNNVTNNVITNVYEQTFTRQNVVPKPPKQSKLTPVEIIKDVRGRPIYQQDEVGKHYINNKIVWRVGLGNIRKYNDILNVAGAFIDGNIVAIVYCEVKEKQYPRLETMNLGDEFFIKGVISSADANSVEIKDCTLIFVD